MNSLYLTFQVYLAFARKSCQKQMQYRVASLAGLITNFFFLLVYVFVDTAFYAVYTGPHPLNIEELIKTVYEDNLTLERKLAEPIPSDRQAN